MANSNRRTYKSYFSAVPGTRQCCRASGVVSAG